MSNSDNVPLGARFGITTIHGKDREEIKRAFEADYRYLLQADGFISGILVESTAEPGMNFHLTEWESSEHFSAIRKNPEVARILGELLAGTTLKGNQTKLVISVDVLRG